MERDTACTYIRLMPRYIISLCAHVCVRLRVSVCLSVPVCLPLYWFLTYWDQRYWMIELLITTYRAVCVNIQWYISHVAILTVPIEYILHTDKVVMFEWNVFVNRNLNNSKFSLSRTWALIIGNNVHDTLSLSYETYRRTYIYIYIHLHERTHSLMRTW